MTPNIDDLDEACALILQQQLALHAMQEDNQALRVDAERWRAMREDFVSMDWRYQGRPDIAVAIFMMHGSTPAAGPDGADCVADASIAARQAKEFT